MYFYLGKHVQRVDKAFQVKENLEIENIKAYVPSLEAGLGFILFIREEVLSMLETYTYDNEAFPENLDSAVLSYGINGKRNFNKLAQQREINRNE